ncbi:MAG: anion transporter [Polyangiaceae bacterium]
MVAELVFVFTYIAFSAGRIPYLRSDRLAAAIIGSVVLVAAGTLSIGEAQAAVDAGTLGLLFGIMILSAALEVSGAFSFVGHWVTQRAKSPLALLAGVSLASAVLSAFLINDVVCIAFTPLVLQIARALDRDPKPYLLVLATSSNIGSSATITGNPQNILIGSLSHLPYSRFVLLLAPVAIVALAINLALHWLFFRAELTRPFAERAEVRPPRVYRRWVWKGGLLMLGVVVGFIVGVPPVVAALVGASAMLVTRAADPKRLYVRVDWTLLTLFASLFIVVAGIEKEGLAARTLAILEPLRPDTVWGLTAITAILSNVVSNVPAVMALKSVVPHLPNQESAWLTLAMASTLAGNLTLPGSLATIIVVERAKTTTQISFFDFLKVGAPGALASLAIGAAWLAWLR